MQRYAYMAIPAINSLNEYYEINNEYPENINDLPLSEVYISNIFGAKDEKEINGVKYFDYLVIGNRDKFLLTVRWGWEVSLVYRSWERNWSFFREVNKEIINIW